MYRTLLATCGAAELQMFLPMKNTYYCMPFTRRHTLRATCGTLPCNENELLTRHLAMRTNSLLTRQLSNKYKLPTHTLQARYGTFTLLQFQFLIPNFQPVSPFPKVRKLFVSPSFPLHHSYGATRITLEETTISHLKINYIAYNNNNYQ